MVVVSALALKVVLDRPALVFELAQNILRPALSLRTDSPLHHIPRRQLPHPEAERTAPATGKTGRKPPGRATQQCGRREKNEGYRYQPEQGQCRTPTPSASTALKTILGVQPRPVSTAHTRNIGVDGC